MAKMEVEEGGEEVSGKGKRRSEVSAASDAASKRRKSAATPSKRGASSGEEGKQPSGLPASGSELAFWLSSPAIPLPDKLAACSPLLDGTWKLAGGEGEGGGGGGDSGRLARSVLQFAAMSLLRAIDPAKKGAAKGSVGQLWRLVELALQAPPVEVASTVSGPSHPPSPTSTSHSPTAYA